MFRFASEAFQGLGQAWPYIFDAFNLCIALSLRLCSINVLILILMLEDSSIKPMVSVIKIERERESFLLERIGENEAHSQPVCRPVSLPDFWQVIVMWVFIRSTWRLCHLIELPIICRLSSVQSCHLGSSYILRSLSINIFLLLRYKILHK